MAYRDGLSNDEKLELGSKLVDAFPGNWRKLGDELLAELFEFPPNRGLKVELGVWLADCGK